MSLLSESNIQAMQEQANQIHEDPVEIVMANQVLEVPQEARQEVPQEARRFTEEQTEELKLRVKTMNNMITYHKKLVTVPETSYITYRATEFQQTNEACKVASTKKAVRKKTLKTQLDVDKQISTKLANEYSSINTNLTARNFARAEIAKAEFRSTSPQ